MTEAPAGWPPLEVGERVMAEPEEFYLQVSPRLFQNGVVNGEAFRPSDDDPQRLSGASSENQTPQGSYDERCALGRQTVGTIAVTMPEVTHAKLRCVDDSANVPAPPTGHAFLDWRLPSTREWRKSTRDLLAVFATRRGRLYP